MSRGLSIVEVLISAGLLTVLSGLFFSLIVPAMQRENWYGKKQTDVRSFLVARELLSETLANTLVLNAAPFPDGTDTVLVQFHRPLETSTPVGDLGIFDIAEFVPHDMATIREIRLTSEGLLLHFDPASGTAVRSFWNLGPGATATVTISPDLRRVDFQFAAPVSDRFSTKSQWEYTIAAFTR